MARTEFQIQVISHFASCSRTRSSAHCCLTLRSSGAPTAGHQARAALWLILHRAGLASYRRRPLNSNVRPQERQVRCIFLNSLKPYSFRAYFSQLRMLSNPKLIRATQVSRDISVVKVKTAFANTVPTLFEHLKHRSGCIQSTMRLQPVAIRRTLAHSVKHKARCRLRFYIGSCSCCRRSFNSMSVSLLRYLNIVCILNLRPNPSFKRSVNGRPPGPRGTVVYPAPRGPGVLPSSPA